MVKIRKVQKTTIAGMLVFFFIFSAVFCCCFSDFVQADEVELPCHQQEQQSDHSDASCDCENEDQFVLIQDSFQPSLLLPTLQRVDYKPSFEIVSFDSFIVSNKIFPETIPIYLQDSSFRI